MTREELIEKVALDIAEKSVAMKPISQIAQSVIDIVLEQAAKICEGGKPFSFKHDERRPLTANECAAAIRALKGE